MSLGTSAYRQLLRARSVAFNGDVLALNTSREAIRKGITANRNETDTNKLAEMMKEVAEADEMLRYHILQGKKNERGNFAVNIRADTVDRLSANEHITHIDEENIPLKPKAVITKHTAPKKCETE